MITKVKISQKRSDQEKTSISRIQLGLLAPALWLFSVGVIFQINTNQTPKASKSNKVSKEGVWKMLKRAVTPQLESKAEPPKNPPRLSTPAAAKGIPCAAALASPPPLHSFLHGGLGRPCTHWFGYMAALSTASVSTGETGTEQQVLSSQQARMGDGICTLYYFFLQEAICSVVRYTDSLQ